MSSNITGEKLTTSNNSYIKDGKKFFERTIIVETWNNLNPKVKFSLGAYVCISIMSYCFMSYHDSKDALYTYKTSKDVTPIGKWNAVKFGASKNMYENMVSSFLLPYTVISKIIPSLVLYFNDK